MELWPFQKEAVQAVRQQLLENKKRIILYLPTGGGKTEVGIDFIRRAREKKKKVSFICNRIELIKQASRRLEKSEIPHGIIQGMNTCLSWEDVQVCSIQTLNRRGFPPADLFIIDEAHRTASSNAYKKLISQYPNVPMIGLSATPFTKGLAATHSFGKLWEALVPAATIRELISGGYLVDVDIYAPDEPDLSKVKIVAGDYDETQLGEAVDKPVLIGNIVEHWLKFGQNKPTVCFATNIAHSQHIVREFESAGVAAEHIDCYTVDSDRKAMLDRVYEGKTKIISNVGILQEGWDFPACEVMILARPTKSLTLYIQMSGRILRRFEGKERATILDHSGTCRRLGFPTDDLPLHLDEGTKEAKERVKNEKATREQSLPTKCPQCSFMISISLPACPKCGWKKHQRKNEVHVKSGELVKVTRGEKHKRTPFLPQDRNDVYAQLLHYGRKHGFKDGWAWHKCIEIFGTAPKDKPLSKEPTEKVLGMIRHWNIRYAKSTRARASREVASLFREAKNFSPSSKSPQQRQEEVPEESNREPAIA